MIEYIFVLGIQKEGNNEGIWGKWKGIEFEFEFEQIWTGIGKIKVGINGIEVSENKLKNQQLESKNNSKKSGRESWK